MRKSNAWKGDLVMIAGILFLACLAAAGANQYLLGLASPRAGRARAAAGAVDGGPELGAEVVIRGKFRGRAFLADERAWEDLLEAENAQSTHLLERLVRKGGVISVADGTPGIVVKKSALSLLVEITGGESAGEEGWIQREFVARNGSEK